MKVEIIRFFIDLVIKYELIYQVNHNVAIHDEQYEENHMSHIS